MNHARYLLAGLMATSVFAQEAKSNPIHLGVTTVFNQGDLLKYAGGKSKSYAFEAGYELLPAEDGIGSTIYGRYMRTFGDRRYPTTGTPGVTDFPANGVKFALDTVTLGLDLTFATPIKGLVPYAGVNLNYYDGAKRDAFLGPKYAFEDSKAKFGIRIGAEYRITPVWSVAADYTFTEWRSESKDIRLPGYNPVNPSWVGLTVRYHFAY